MKGAKYILTVAVIAMSSVMMTGCFKPSKDAVVESKYYQSLKDERDKLSVQLKEEKKKTSSLNKKIKAIHATSGDQKIADYKSRVKDSRIIKVDFKNQSFAVTNTIKNQSFAVTNIPVCKYVKKIVTGCNRMIGITPTDVEKQYKQSYSYALIDEDNTTFEFKVYGDSYIVFDEIPENVYAYNGASTVGDALIDAAEQKNYSSVAARIADAQIIVTDKKMKFNDTAIKVSKVVEKAKKLSGKDAVQDTTSWNEYRFYTSGTLTKILLGDRTVIGIEDKNGKQTFYQISNKQKKNLQKYMK